MLRRYTVVALLALAATSAAAQTGTVAGTVTDTTTKLPVPAVQITAIGGLRTIAGGQSADDGSYRVAGLAPGRYTIVAQRIGYGVLRVENVEVTASATATANLGMTPIAVLLNPRVTTASRGATADKRLDTPASIEVVTSDRIETTPAAIVTDYLKTVPGLSVSTGGLVQSNTVSRGFNNAFSGSMLMMQDYRFAGAPVLRVNVPFLLTASTEDVDRIEVLNGPASALYGPNSANGVLHVITKSPFDSKGTTVTIDGGGQSFFRTAARHAGVFGGERWGYKLSSEYFSGTDWEYHDPNEPLVYPGTAPPGRVGQPVIRDFADRRYTGEARLDYRGGDIENSLTTGLTHIGSSIEVTAAFGAQQVKNWTFKSYQDRFRYKRFFGQVFFNDNNAGNADKNDLRGTHALRTGIPVIDHSNVLAGQAQQAFDVSRARMVLGADYILTRPKSEGTIYGRNEGAADITETGAYLQSTVPLVSKLDLMSAVRVDQNDRLKGVQFSPQAALLYRLTDLHNVRLMFSRAFNSPTAFNFFIDAVQQPNVAPGGFDVRVIGNPPKDGWQFPRTCDASVNTGLCMRSPWVAGGPSVMVSASGAASFPGFVASLPAIVNGLPTLSATQKAQLLALLGPPPNGIGPILAALRPTSTQVGGVLRQGTTTVGASSLQDIRALAASFNNTWQVGYRGIVDRLRLGADAWWQRRGDVGVNAAAANAFVFYDPAALGVYLTTSITQGLVAAGLSQAQAQATAAAAAGALVPLMAQLPQGTVTMTGTTGAASAADQSLIATYTMGQGHLDVAGVDLAADWQVSGAWMLGSTYSFQNKIVFPEIGGDRNPLMSNSPKHRASFSGHYVNAARGWGFDGVVRYADAFPVNSGVLNSLTPNPTGGVVYPPVPAQTQVDAGVNYRPAILRGVTWSLNASNLFNDRVPTFVGTPAIGRLLVTRLRYQF
jgi:outer membrane receptor for ferrienterochelin and colicins